MLDDSCLLGWLQLLPLIAALALLLVRDDRLALSLGVGCALLELGGAIRLYQLLDLNRDGWQWSQRIPLVREILVYTVGADGMTVLFVLLTAFLTLLVVVYGGLVRRFTPLASYLSPVLACEAVLMGQFVTLDLLWFTLLALVHSVLIGHLLTNWSGESIERLALHRYYQFMGSGLLMLLVATLMLGWHHADITNGGWRFELEVLLKDPRSRYLQNVIFFLLYYGLAIRLPVFPLHGWLPQVMEHGTVVTAMVLLLGLKTGIYGMVRFLIPLFPDAVWQWHTYAIAIAAVGIFYSALLALVQQNLRKLLAYAVISHTGILIIGLFTLHPHAFQGSVILTGTFGLSIGTLLLMAGIVYVRTQTMVMSRLGGLFHHLPLVGSAFLIAALSVVGMPGTPGFDAVHLFLEAAIDHFGALLTVAAALGNVAAAACLLWAFQRVFLATPAGGSGVATGMRRATLAENGLAALLIAVQLTSGFYADPWLDLVKRASQHLAHPYAERGERP
ncbi:MAG: NADH-quinone oxidoreductase subunit M [Magnetococcales bacterium]|nr:NADH-quinone oxidoreductase subunit M [Magnetococcales bacterium]